MEYGTKVTPIEGLRRYRHQAPECTDNVDHIYLRPGDVLNYEYWNEVLEEFVFLLPKRGIYVTLRKHQFRLLDTTSERPQDILGSVLEQCSLDTLSDEDLQKRFEDIITHGNALAKRFNEILEEMNRRRIDRFTKFTGR